MPQDRATSDSNYERFIATARETGEVWGLNDGEGWAYSESNEFEDTDVLLFWSTQAEAKTHAQGEWNTHQPMAIPLDEFIDGWLLGMHQDGALVGPNWDAGLNGLEVEPEEVADHLTSEEE